MTIRTGLAAEIVAMAFDTVRSNKMRSSLTVLGIIIGITALVGMISLIRGFDQSLRDTIRELGPSTIFVARFSGVSFASGKSFIELMKRPNLSIADGRAIERNADLIQIVDVTLGGGFSGTPRVRVFYANLKNRVTSVF